MTVHPSPRGFADPVMEAQVVFRTVMMALARPGEIRDLATDLVPPAPFTPELAAIALALCDHETPVWVDHALAASPEIAAFIKFQTGAPITDDPAAAAFAFAVDMTGLPFLAEFAQGTDEYPDRSTTLALAVSAIGTGRRLVLEGPGIKDRAFLALDGLPADFPAQLAENRRRFPRGVDCIFAAAGKVAALPRSTRVTEA